jgi:hypothetical protein
MIQLTELPVDIYYIINKLLYSYDNNLRLVNKSINQNDEFITCYNKIIKNRLLKLKKKYSCIKIQLFIKNYIYNKSFWKYYGKYYTSRLYIPLPNYHLNNGINFHLPTMILDPWFLPERIIENNNDNIINKSTKYTKKKNKKSIKYNKKLYNKRINYKRINYKSYKHSYRKK